MPRRAQNGDPPDAPAPRRPRNNGVVALDAARSHLGGTQPDAAANDDLGRFVDRLERLELDRREAVEAFNVVLLEAKDKGYGKRALRAVVKRRLESDEEKERRNDFEEELDRMFSRLGMLRDTPLGQAAESAARTGAM